MKRHFLYLIISVVLFTGCTVVITPEAPEAKGNIAVNLKSNITSSSLKVTNNRFDASDEVGLYMKRAGQALAIFSVYSNADNVHMNHNGIALVSDPPLMYPEISNVDFIAYYPYTAAVSSDYTIDVSVAGQASGLPAEVLYSNNVRSQMPTSAPVTLNFFYMLAKLEITVTNGEVSPLFESDFNSMTASIDGMYTQAKLQLTDGEITNRQSIQQITLYKKESDENSATFEALILPTMATDGEITFSFHVNGVTYQHKRTVNYDSHSLYRLNFELNFSSSDPMATLLDTHIFPRNEYPIENIPIEVAMSKMTMTTAKMGTVGFEIGGSGKIVIDWGDGTPTENYILSSNLLLLHDYSITTYRTITIYGENITYFNCILSWTPFFSFDNQFTSLDVSNNTNLIELLCGNNFLSELDVSKNTALTSLQFNGNQISSLDLSNNTLLTILLCQNNRFTSSALNVLFETLHGNAGSKVIYINGNPGTATCDESIATNKGWVVIDVN